VEFIFFLSGGRPGIIGGVGHLETSAA